jgi:hypothetical protein
MTALELAKRTVIFTVDAAGIAPFERRRWGVDLATQHRRRKGRCIFRPPDRSGDRATPHDAPRYLRRGAIRFFRSAERQSWSRPGAFRLTAIGSTNLRIGKHWRRGDASRRWMILAILFGARTATGDRTVGPGIFFTCFYVLMAVGPLVAGHLQDVFGIADRRGGPARGYRAAVAFVLFSANPHRLAGRGRDTGLRAVT